MKKNLYISASSQANAQHAATLLSPIFNIVSTWHNPNLNVDANTHPDCISFERKQEYAVRNFSQIVRCDVYLLIGDQSKVAGGKFVEAGVAIANNKRVVIAGRLENMMLFYPGIELYQDTIHFFESESVGKVEVLRAGASWPEYLPVAPPEPKPGNLVYDGNARNIRSERRGEALVSSSFLERGQTDNPYFDTSLLVQPSQPDKPYPSDDTCIDGKCDLIGEVSTRFEEEGPLGAD